MTYRSEELEPPRKRRKLRPLRLIFLLVIVATGAAALAYRQPLWGRFTRVLAAQDDEPIPTQKLERVSFKMETPAIGEITGLETVPVVTPSTRGGGFKVAWLIPEGTFVEAGDPVVRFDSTDAWLNLEQQRNTLEANQERTRIATGKQTTDDKVLRIDRSDAEKEYQHAVTVMPQDETIFSKWDIIEAKINATFAKERIDFLSNKGRVQKRIARADAQILAIEKNRARAEISIAQQTLDSLELKAPKSGLVVYRRDRMREPQIGDEAWRGQILVEVVDLHALQARIYILERDAAGLESNKPVEIHLDSIPGKTFHGTIQSVASLAQNLERNSPLKYFACQVNIKDAYKDMVRIKPGMSLKADVILDEYDSCFVVPAGAVTLKGEESLVYVKKGNTFVPRPVKIGNGMHGQAVVLSGVKENETIAMRNPFETRTTHLPDFTKASELAPGTGAGMRIFMR